ncbi:MAG: hypothetical protein KAR22_12710, partial [Gammaproteobacteria bacterium]|nr:hypothetical protein [Gammaproteobacteria bacterium]
MLILAGGSKVALADAARPERQGGENSEDAFDIPGLPFIEDGTTAGYGWDAPTVIFGSWCIGTPDGPDVFYRFVPEQNMFINVDLCGSEGETWLIVADHTLVAIDCFSYDSCGYEYGPISPCGSGVS